MSNKIIKENKKQKKDAAVIEIVQNILEYVICVLGIAISVLVPLYLKNGYHGVGDCKYELYKILMIIGTALLAFVFMVGLLQGTGFLKSLQTGTAIVENPAGLRKKLADPGIWVLLFLLFALIAAAAGGNFARCMVGYSGWYMGFLSLVSFAVLYYFFFYTGRYYKAVLFALLATSFLTYIFGILNRMLIDVLGTYGMGTAEEINDSYKNQFLSTLGQASWYSSFVCTAAPIGFAIFLYAKNTRCRIAGGIFTFAASMTLVTQNSDSAYMAMLGFLFVFFWFSVKSAEGFRHFCELLVLFAAAARTMRGLLAVHPNPVLELDALSSFMVYSDWMWGILLLAVAMLGLSIWLEKNQKYPVFFMKKLRIVLLILILAGLFTAAFILFLGAWGKLPDSLLAVIEKIPYMSWSDNWGNGRGRTWSFSIQMFKDMDILHKLFGVGPDGYADYAYSLYAGRLEEMWGSRTLTNAHNEWLNALISYGLFGAIAYIGIFISSVRAFAKKTEKEPVLVGFIACIVSYMCHNFFCYQTVCCTPYIFMIMGMGMYICRKNGVMVK